MFKSLALTICINIFFLKIFLSMFCANLFKSGDVKNLHYDLSRFCFLIESACEWDWVLDLVY